MLLKICTMTCEKRSFFCRDFFPERTSSHIIPVYPAEKRRTHLHILKSIMLRPFQLISSCVFEAVLTSTLYNLIKREDKDYL